MSTSVDAEMTPLEFIAETATRKSALDLDSLALLGTIGTAEAPVALIRTPGGAITRYGLGDTLGVWRVDDISDTRAILVRENEAAALYIPGSTPEAPTSLRPRARPSDLLDPRRAA